MAMDGNDLGDEITDFILGYAGIAPNGTDEARWREIWRGIATKIVSHIQSRADIDLAISDIKVLPGTFQEQLPTNGPIIGEGVNDAVILEQKIK